MKGAQLKSYQENWNLSVERRVARYPPFALRLPLHAKPCEGRTVIGQRLEMWGRHIPLGLKEKSLPIPANAAPQRLPTRSRNR